MRSVRTPEPYLFQIEKKKEENLWINNVSITSPLENRLNGGVWYAPHAVNKE